jgi:hypothetical protein
MTGAIADILGVALVVMAVLLGYAAWVAIDTMRASRRLIDDVQARLPDLLEHADETLASVDGVVTQLEEVSDAVSTTTRAASEAVKKPLAGLMGVGAGIREVVTGLRRR